MSTGKCPCGFSCTARDGLVDHVEESRHGGAMWEADNGSVLVLNPPTGKPLSFTPAAEFAAGGPGHGGFIGAKPMESSTAVPEPSLLNALNEISAAVKENTAITREAWAAVLSQQQPEAPLMQSDFEVKDLTVHDDDGYVAPHDRLMRLVQATQGMDGHTPVHFLVEGTIYSLGIEQKDLMGLIARVR